MFKKLKKIFVSNEKKQEEPNPNNSKEKELKESSIKRQVDANISLLKEIYNVPENLDVKFRNVTVGGSSQKCCLIFISTISNVPMLEDNVIKPLVNNKEQQKRVPHILTVSNIRYAADFKTALLEINRGNAILIADGEDTAFIIESANFKSRGIEQVQNEVIVKGPKEAFTESAGTNISLLRKRLKNENMVVESVKISERSGNEVAMLYVKNLANEQLIGKVRNRLQSLSADAIQNLPLLEQYLEDRKISLFPTILYTERPDRAASFIEDGHIVLVMDNSPDSLIMPATFWSFFHTPEEHYLRFPFGNFTRALRITALFISIFASAIYVAITNYHSEMIPADLLLAIASTRERVPFPIIVEILMMEMAFELIREAGLRVPSPIGPTIGIVGALILGQAAVEANIISPVVIIVVALGGLTSFAVSDISLNFTVRLTRFLFILASGAFGIYGMTAFFIVGIFYMVSISSFGVPYLSPMSPKYKSSNDTIFRRLLENEKFRPGYLKPKDIKKKGNEA
ncbi:spore germination protein [Mesobacillus harenae]|uniref:spore germination protein n=1 Tax=Mesobacillus harenae TaxID=2213203 RepID=UPI00157FF512|nr:spore germination protein [Mesobacillus harenae]